MSPEENLHPAPEPRDLRRMRVKSRPWEIAITYAVLGTFWIFFSDQILAFLVPDSDRRLAWNSYKGIGFVIVTAVLLLLLLMRAFNAIGEAYDSMQASERALRNEQLFTDTMIESMPGILYFYDSAGRFLRWNQNFETVSGYSEKEIGTMHPLDFFIAEDQPIVEQRLAEVFINGEASLAASVVTKDGTVIPYFLTGRRVVFDQKTCLVGIGIDISDRIRMEVEREKRHRAEASDRLKTSFLATMSHELRTPLNSIIGFTGILLQGLPGPLNAEQSKQLGMVRSSARHLLDLVNDVLDISKIEAGQLEVAREPFDLRHSISRVIASVEPLAAAKRLELRVQLAGELGEAVSDERRFEQILLNLLYNAIKFTAQGKVGLEAEVGLGFELRGAVCEHRCIRVRVSDTGIGIQPEELPHLFQPFRQIDSGLLRKQEGTGLGLAICRHLAELMRGEIEVESEWGRGSTFSLTLPLQIPTES